MKRDMRTDTDLRTALRRCMNCLEGSPDEEDVFHALNMGAAALQSESTDDKLRDALDTIQGALWSARAALAQCSPH